MPSVTVCSTLTSTILISEIIKISPPLYKIFYGKSRPEINRLLSRTPIREQLLSVLQSLPIDQQHRFTVSASQFFTECQLPSPINRDPSKMSSTSSNQNNNFYQNNNFPEMNCTQFSPIIETISYEFKCFSLFQNRTNLGGQRVPKNYDIPKDLLTNFKYLLWIQLNRDYMFNGFIYIHPHHSK